MMLKFVSSNKSVYALLIGILLCGMLLVSCGADDSDNTSYHTEESVSEKATEENPLSVIVGNYRYYVDDDSEIEYEDYYTTVNCHDYGIKSYSTTGAPRTTVAAAQLYGEAEMKPFINSNGIEGLIVDNAYESEVKIFCFTVDGTFHAVEIWKNPEMTDSECESVFNTIVAVDFEKERNEAMAKYYEEELEKNAKEAAEQWQRDEIERNTEPPSGARFK